MPRLQSFSALVSLIASFWVFQSLQVTAQIIPDNSLGSESSVIVPNVDINGIDSDRIDGGAIRGNNLFHSFQEFNIDDGRGAYFASPESISNILTRVTGNNLSNILGTLGVLGNANLFLINPNGIVFGPNARLDVGGSFFASTADGILFDNGVEFAASNPDALPLLTINIPLGLNFRGNQGEIRVEGSSESPLVPQIPISEIISSNNQFLGLEVPISILEIISNNDLVGLEVPPGQRLALLGGNITLTGGNLRASGGQVELGSVAGTGYVQLPTVSNQALNYADVSTFGNIELSQAASIDISGNQKGSINIQGQDVTLNTGTTLWSIGLQSGSISINAGNTISISDGLMTSLSLGEEGVGGDTNLSAQSIFLNDFALVANFTISSANSGGIFINASDTVELFNQGNPSLILETNPIAKFVIESLSVIERPKTGLATGSLNAGNAGDILITTSKLTIRNNMGSELTGISTGTRLSTSTGDSGNLMVNASESVEIIGDQPGAFIPKIDEVTASIFSNINTGISTATHGMGDAGNLVINTGQFIIRNGVGISSGNISTSTGNGGNLTVNVSESVELQGLAGIATGTLGPGDAGNLVFNVSNGRVLIRDGAGLVADALGSGDGGDLTLVANELIIRNGSRIGTATANEGAGGDLTIQATSIEISGTSADGTVPSGIFTSTEPQTTGDAGNLTLKTRNLTLTAGAEITASTQGTGNAGNLTLNATNTEVIDSNILSRTSNEGGGGQLNVNAERLNIREGGRISVETQGRGNAGSLTVDATEIELRGTNAEGTESGLFASALSNTSGQGGELTVNTNELVVRDGATIDVSSEGLEAAGDLEINAQSVLLDNQASLNAETAGGEGDIILNTENLSLHRNSNITTNATGEAVGGNLTLNTEILTALENSDISANAQQAAGGRITINADGIFGTQFRQQQTQVSDITATSELSPEFSGTVELNTQFDPSSALIELPVTVVDPATLIAQDFCRQRQGSEFVYTGRGGLPPSPQESLLSQEIFVGLIELPPVESRRSSTPSAARRNASRTPNQPRSSADIIPARGWITDENGDVILVSYDPTKTGVRRQLTQLPQCQS